MKGNFKATSAIAVLESTRLPAPQAKRFGAAVAEQFSEIARTEKMNSTRAILIGMSLPVLKASMERGAFRPWLEANVTNGNNWTKATAIKNASYFTRLAVVFMEQAKATPDDVAALTSGDALNGTLVTKDAAARTLFKRIADFVGEKSINELLNEHSIRNGSGTGGGSTAAESLAAIPADDNTLLQDIAEAMLSLRKTVTDPDTLKRLTAAQINQLQKQLDDTQEDFRKALKTLHAK